MNRGSLRTARVALLVLVTIGAACAPPDADRATHEAATLRGRIDESLARAARYLVERQSEDGAWRSEVYGFFRDGPSLTPHVLSTLYFLAQDLPAGHGSFGRGAEYLDAIVETDGGVPEGALALPVYTSSSASWVLGMAGKTEGQRRWLAFLRARQLNRALGWLPEDREFGGWGYSPILPRKPARGETSHPLVESNLSATLFALGALRAAGIPLGDPAYVDALAFVERCQNFREDGPGDPAFDDGGFFFIPGDAAKNKAGAAGRDGEGLERYHSYGTMTADGTRALLVLGLAPDHPRVVAARRWLEHHFTAERTPGSFNPDREVLRGGLYYYWCWSISHALARLGVVEVDGAAGRVRWAEALGRELLSRQRPDGSWSNPFTDSKEDDPLVATPFAAAALLLCRQALTEVRFV